jgi:hypothetical protein
VFLLYQPHDGSTFTVFTVGETVPWQVFIQGRKRTKIAGCQIWTVWGMTWLSQPNTHQKFRDYCAMCSWALSWRRITPSLRRLGHFIHAHKKCIISWTSKRD